jgi:hypothetical protein
MVPACCTEVRLGNFQAYETHMVVQYSWHKTVCKNPVVQHIARRKRQMECNLLSVTDMAEISGPYTPL